MCIIQRDFGLKYCELSSGTGLTAIILSPTLCVGNRMMMVPKPKLCREGEFRADNNLAHTKGFSDGLMFLSLLGTVK
jgi:hypothetical protein